MKIFNAATRPLSQASLSVPNMAEALDNWFQNMTVCVICKTVVNFQLVETSVTRVIKAVRQPFSSKQLAVKPEGQRAWNWETLHVKFPDNFDVDTVVVFNGTRYRIMNRWEFPEYGYYSFDCVRDFTP